MTKTEYANMLTALECRGAYCIFDSDGKVKARVESDGHGRYSIYICWPCHQSCVASGLNLSELEKIMIG